MTALHIADTRDARTALLAGVRRILQEGGVSGRRVMRLSVPVQDADPLRWLAAQHGTPRIYWSNRDGSFRVAGAGFAARFDLESPGQIAPTFGYMRELLDPAEPSMRFYGGTRFSAGKSSSRWAPFGYGTFVLPLVEVGLRDGEGYMACNLWMDDTALTPGRTHPLIDALQHGEDALGDEPELPSAIVREDKPDEPAWVRGVQSVLDDLKGDLRKAVLARETQFQCDSRVDPVQLLERLGEVTPNSYHFCFEPEPGVAFVGAPPERLYLRCGQALSTEALAGTRPRGLDARDDARLAGELQASAKEQREHGFVCDALAGHLDALCDQVGPAAAPEVLKLQHCQHLLTLFEGRVRDGVSDADLVHALHPTPAVGGVPTDLAVDCIRAVEPFDRGWYTGPVGWVGSDGAEFAVAIRSALVRGSDVHVYTGAGIVQASDPHQEWNEIESKLSDFRQILHAPGPIDGKG